MSIDPTEHAPNESWLLFQLNDFPVRTEQDGDFNVLAIMDVATGIILGMEFMGLTEIEPSEFTSRKLLASAESKAGQRPRRVYVEAAAKLAQFAAAAISLGLEISAESLEMLSPLTQEAREGFAAHISGGQEN